MTNLGRRFKEEVGGEASGSGGSDERRSEFSRRASVQGSRFESQRGVGGREESDRLVRPPRPASLSCPALEERLGCATDVARHTANADRPRHAPHDPRKRRLHLHQLTRRNGTHRSAWALGGRVKSTHAVAKFFGGLTQVWQLGESANVAIRLDGAGGRRRWQGSCPYSEILRLLTKLYSDSSRRGARGHAAFSSDPRLLSRTSSSPPRSANPELTVCADEERAGLFRRCYDRHEGSCWPGTTVRPFKPSPSLVSPPSSVPQRHHSTSRYYAQRRTRDGDGRLGTVLDARSRPVLVSPASLQPNSR